MSRVKTATWRPYSVALARWSASSKSSARMTEATGAKASRATTFISSETEPSTVGWYTGPSRTPPVNSWAPASVASFTQPSMRRASASAIIGPTSTRSSSGSPTTIAWLAPTNRSTKGSYAAPWP